MSQWLTTASTTDVRPSDGRGAAESTAPGTYATNDTLFTPTSVTGATIAAITNVAIGAVIATSGGWWGLITSFDAAPVPDVINVDKWRKMGVLQSSGIPVTNEDLFVVPKFYGSTCDRWMIDWIVLTATVAGSATISRLDGTAIPGLSALQVAAGQTIQLSFVGMEGPNGESSMDLNQPFAVKVSAATTSCTVGYRALAD